MSTPYIFALRFCDAMRDTKEMFSARVLPLAKQLIKAEAAAQDISEAEVIERWAFINARSPESKRLLLAHANDDALGTALADVLREAGQRQRDARQIPKTQTDHQSSMQGQRPRKPTMKTTTSLCYLLLAFTTLAQDATPGRYQIIAATVLEDGRPRPIILRLDTTTGKTDELTIGTVYISGSNGASLTAWSHIDDNFGATAMKLQRAHIGTNPPAKVTVELPIRNNSD